LSVEPNQRNLRELQSDEALDALISQLTAKRTELAKRHNKQVPVFIKIAPDLDEAQITVIATL
jgi:dihydroorotate dehydrogenase